MSLSLSLKRYTNTVAVVGTPQLNIRSCSFHRPWRRKRRSLLVIRSSSNDFLSQVTPALGFTTALAALVYKFKLNSNSTALGDWTLLTSPTPFNRFVNFRCPSLLLRLEEEEEAVITGRIQQLPPPPPLSVVYQRVCVNTDDGGVVSLDWPAHLELSLEQGLDTTILIVPGTTDGSMDESVRSFVYECLTRGCFPIVMNPRGCARSPLTTPRLFTAADSDDISAIVHFINRARPWTTFMAVGFGFGANMLTKYLAQVGQETPLTAATCLDNPFDLNGGASNHNLTNGFINLLQSNKELFMGPSKRFDVEKALQATSLKDFEEAISMVSYGFDSIEEFYVSSSTRDVVGNVKIPLLFIQNNAMPSVSIPRSLIAENPFTSLLICTFQSDDKSTADISWCRQLVVEWLTAVELGLLKGRHPLLEDSDVTISPSKQMTTSPASSRSNKVVNFHQLDGSVNTSSILDLRMTKDKDATNGMVTQTDLVDLKEGGDADSERGKVLQATQVVMNMLDGTMPEALSEEQKLKVLTAVNQGETLMNALQDAVPEDVRGKLSSSVITILENQKKTLNGRSHVPDGTSALNTKMQERSVGLSSVEKEKHASELNTSLTEEDSNNHPFSKNDASGNIDDASRLQGGEISNSETTSNRNQDDFSNETAAQFHDSDSSVVPDVSRKMERSEDHISDQVNLGLEGGTNVEKDNRHKDATTDISTPPRTEKEEGDKGGELSNSETTSNRNQDDFSNETAAQFHDSDSSVTPDISRKMERSEDHISDQVNLGLEGGTNVEKDNRHKDASTDISTPPKTEKEEGDNQKKEESSASSNSPSFSVSQALGALTGMDDSTQVAVNSVFSVIEDVITHLEGNRENGSQLVTESESAAPPQKEGDEKSSMTTELKQVGTMSNSREKKDEANKNPQDIRNSITRLPYRNSITRLPKMKNDKQLQLDTLCLDYVPEEGQYKLLDVDVPSHEPSDVDVECNSEIIEPTYVILDDWDPVGEKHETDDVASVEHLQFVKDNILKSLEVEVSRRIQATYMADVALELKKELENVANIISLAVVDDKPHGISFGNLQDEHVLDTISSAVQGTRYMKEVIPVGIVVGSTLASLRKIVNINAAADQNSDSQVGYHLQADTMAADEVNQNKNLYIEDGEKDASSSLSSDTVMVGAVTAALGASALLVHKQNSYSDELESRDKKENAEEPGKVEEEERVKSGDNIATSLAEKAMSVAGPVVPTKEDGGVDQDRLVAVLADLGQKGGILKLVGKVALLWGGIRGAMSLIGKLFSFLHLAERPLFQRILGFVCMVLVLWTPVVVPLLPTLVQNWAAHNSSKYAELACIMGLYGSIMMLVVLWGERIRGYENPLERYGLELTSATQIQQFVYGLIGGVMLVLLIQYTNVLLGLVSLSWPSIPSSSTDLLNLSGKVIRFVGQGLVTAVAVALVEELLFRSWLSEEIAVDLGYNQGIILSGLAFSLSQWSLKAIPGLWLLSVGLAGVRQRCQGRLSVPIGLRAGIMASTFLLKEAGLLTYQQHSYPLWVTGGDPFQPFNTIVGLAVAFLWAAILYPQQPENVKE
ncbi:putative alcohol O-acetyltransferase [Helianthus annuus]|nr:putative alcohol O-acetyltransferase [Helianthus annuus]KAJ0531846.1 putative alcohol O-acetyltransferase [Helianthus annuus]